MSRKKMELVANFPNYKINEEGQVFKILKDGSLRLLKQSSHAKGMMVTLVKEGKRYWRLVHTLMVKTFVKEERTKVEHIDGDRTNNDLDNLRVPETYTETLEKGVPYVMEWVQRKIRNRFNKFVQFCAEANKHGLDGCNHMSKMLPIFEEKWQKQAQGYANNINGYYGTELELWDLYVIY